jgi:hypothetical protein
MVTNKVKSENKQATFFKQSAGMKGIGFGLSGDA